MFAKPINKNVQNIWRINPQHTALLSAKFRTKKFAHYSDTEYGIADPGATSQFITAKSHCINEQLAAKPLAVTQPNGNRTMQVLNPKYPIFCA